MARIAFVVLMPLLVLVPASAAPAADPLETAKDEIHHADTYYWYGMAEKGNMRALAKGLVHLDRAAAILEPLPAGERRDALLRQVEALRTDIEEQGGVHGDTLFGVYPLVRHLAPTLFSDALATGTFELIDDAPVMASTAAAFNLSRDALLHQTVAAQLDVAFNSLPEDKALENEVLYVFNLYPRFFVHNYREIAAALSPAEVEAYRANDLDRIAEFKDRLLDAFDVDRLLVVTVDRVDKVGDDYFYVVHGRLWERDGSVPALHLQNMGFSRDRTDQLTPILLFHLAFLVLAVLVSLTAARLSGERGASGPGRLLLPVLAFAAGRVLPWALVPMLSLIAPVPETLAKLSFWWPCAAGVVLFAAPALLVHVAAMRLRRLLPVLDPAGREPATLLATALGVGAYLAVPLHLLEQEAAPAVLLPAVVAGGAAAWLLGRVVSDRCPGRAAAAIAAAAVLLGLGAAVCHSSPGWTATCAAVAIAAAGLVEIALRGGSREELETLAAVPIDAKAPEGVPELIRATQAPPYRRGESFARAIEAAAPALEGRAVHLALVGPAGVGKTATAAAVLGEIAERCAETGRRLRVLRGECAPADEDAPRLPYGPFRQALAGCVRIPLPGAKDEAGRSVDAVLGGIVESAIPFAGLLLPSASSDPAPVQSREQLFRAVARTLRGMGRRDTVALFLDDTQWLDDASRELLAHLRGPDGIRPGDETSFLLLTTARAAGAPVEGGISCELGMPDEEDLRGILVGGLALAPEIAGEVLRETAAFAEREGGLFWPLRVVGHLAETGRLERRDGAFAWSGGARPEGDLPVPADYRAAIEAQLDRLGEHRTILECAACLGRSFDAAVLAESLEMPRLDLLTALGRIELESGILRDVRERDDRYAFRSTHVLSLIRERLDLSDRGPTDETVPQLVREYHARAAAAIRRRGGAGAVYEVARHAYAAGAGMAAEAAMLCLDAGGAARRELLFDQARRFADMAEECAAVSGGGADVGRERLLVDLFEAHVTGEGRPEAARAGLEWIRARDPDVELLTELARVCHEVGDEEHRAHAERLARRILEVAPGDGAPLGHAEGLQLLALTLPAGEDEARVEHLERALSLAGGDGTGEAALRARIANTLADVLARAFPDRRDRARELYEESIRLKESLPLPDLPGLARSHGGLGRLAFFFSDPPDLEAARTHFRRDLEISENLCDVDGQSMMLSLLGAVAFAAGDPREALESYRRSLEVAASPANAGFATSGLVECHLALSEADEATAVVREYLRTLDGDRGVPSRCRERFRQVLEAGAPAEGEPWAALRDRLREDEA